MSTEQTLANNADPGDTGTGQVSNNNDESNDGDSQNAEELIDTLTQAVSQNMDTPDSDGNDVSAVHPITDNLVITQDPEEYVLSEPDGEHNGLTTYSDAPKREVPPDRTFISDNGDVDTMEELIRAIASENRCPMLIGDAGTGKNTSIDALYSELNQPVYRQQMGSGLTVHDLFAETELRDGDTVTTLKAFGKAAMFGGVAVVDEINLANDRLIANLNSMAEKQGQRRVPIPGTGVTLTDLPEDTEWDADKHLGKYIHPEFRVAATRNPPSYSGAEALNFALNDRFSPIRYDYPDIDVESKLLAQDIGADKDQIKPLVEVIHNGVRVPRSNNAGTSCPVSYRRLIDAVEYSKYHDVTLHKAGIAKIAGYAQDAADRQKIEGALNDKKMKLDIVIGGENATLNCGHCGHEVELSNASGKAKQGVCPDCESPHMQDDEWETNYGSSHVARFRWAEHGPKSPTLLISFWGASDSKLTTYRYDGVSKSDYEDMCDASSKGRFVNGIKDDPSIDAEKIGEIEGVPVPKPIDRYNSN